MQDIIQKYISRILSTEIKIKIPSDIVTYFFKEELERNFKGDEEIVNKYFNPLEEICRKQDFSFGSLVTNAHIKPNVMKKREYVKQIGENIITLENTVDIYFLGEKSTSLCFSEGQENQALLNEFQKNYLEKPQKMITDLATGGFVLYKDKKRIVLTMEGINKAWVKALENSKERVYIK